LLVVASIATRRAARPIGIAALAAQPAVWVPLHVALSITVTVPGRSPYALLAT
jgi:hypothetical protein